MHAFRTRLQEDIVSEFLPSQKKGSRDVIIFCDGMPGLPGNIRLMEYWSRKGYWTFYPRYRGTWESDGEFLKDSPDKDILDVIDALPNGFVSVWDGVRYQVVPEKLIIVGCSFGGPAVLLLSKDPRVTHVIGLSAVVDWTADSEEEPLDGMYEKILAAFGNGYRMTRENWDKLKSGKFYNPMRAIEDIDGSKVLLIHAMDDTIVPFSSLEIFVKKTGCRLLRLKKGGHLSSSLLRTWWIGKRMSRFFHSHERQA